MSRTSWIPVASGSDFSLYNFPLGIGQLAGGSPRVVSRIGDHVVNLSSLADAGLVSAPIEHLESPTLNSVMAGGRGEARTLRQELMNLFDESNSRLRDDMPLRSRCLHPIDEVEMLLPISIGDYTDFYSSREHATNVGSMFRDPKNALLPNWVHMPIAYHGRASSIVVSGTPIHRPKGQTRPNDSEPPIFGPAKQLDFELEVAFVICGETSLGESIPTDKAEEHIFGLVLFNDWSARDIQKWEYQPLGPFLSKNFASSMSPWVVTLDALEPFRMPGSVQSPEPVPYLRFTGDRSFDINLEAMIQIDSGDPGSAKVVSRTNFKHLYWNMSQQLAHHTVNGCNVRTADIMASGTISGTAPDSFGSMLELTWNGRNPLLMADGSERSFIQDGDTVIMRGWAERDGVRVGFGEVRNRVLPALT